MPLTRLAMDGILADAIATAAGFDPAAVYVGVYVSGPEPSPPVTVADFVLPDPTDFPAQKLTSWSAIHYLNDGRSCVDSPARTFKPASSATGTVLAGAYIADAATAGNVLEWIPFPGAVPVPDEHYSVTVYPRLTVDGEGRWDASVIING